MNISQNGINLIKKFEGCKLTSYQDITGVWTIGYGHTKGVTANQTITQTEAEKLLENDLNSVYAPLVSKYNSTYHWNQNQFDALVSFCYNIGSIDQLTQNGKRTISEISNKILAYNKANGKTIQGLTNRRKAEKILFDTPVNTTQNITSRYIKGHTYTITASSLAVRYSPSIHAKIVPYRKLSNNAKQHAKNNTGYLLKGTKITCKDTSIQNEDIWIQIPSGWIAGYYQKHTYVQ